jgi:hypothetical protein
MAEQVRRGEEPKFKLIPVDKYGPVKVSPPLSVKIICSVLFLFAFVGFSAAIKLAPWYRGEELLPPGTTLEFLRLTYLANLLLSGVNLLLGIVLLLLVRWARIATLVMLALECGYAFYIILAKASILQHVVIPMTDNPSLSKILLFLIICVAILAVMLILGCMAIALLDSDVEKVYEKRPTAPR